MFISLFPFNVNLYRYFWRQCKLISIKLFSCSIRLNEFGFCYFKLPPTRPLFNYLLLVALVLSRTFRFIRCSTDVDFGESNNICREAMQALSGSGWMKLIGVLVKPDPLTNIGLTLSTILNTMVQLKVILMANNGAQAALLMSNGWTPTLIESLGKVLFIISMQYQDQNLAYYRYNFPFLIHQRIGGHILHLYYYYYYPAALLK